MKWKMEDKRDCTKEKQKGWKLNIKDKHPLSKTKFCPPHCFPHRPPFTKPITKEPCHIHKAKWRMLHHKLFCKFLKCPHYKFMIKNYKNKTR